MDTFELLRLYKKTAGNEDQINKKVRRYLICLFSDFCYERAMSEYDINTGEEFNGWLKERDEGYRVKNSAQCFVKELNKLAGIKKEKRSMKETNKENSVLLNEYNEYLLTRCTKVSSVRGRISDALYTLCYFKEIGYEDITKIKAKELLIRYSSKKLPFIERKKHLSFLKWLFESRHTDEKLYLVIPKPFIRTEYNPSFYKHDEIKKILDTLESENDYSSLLAYSLIFFIISTGLRSIDIRNLKLQNIDFVHKMIEFRQIKTGTLSRFYISDTLINTIYNYLNIRPDSEFEFLFLNRNGKQLSSAQIYKLISESIKKADIKTGKRKKGAHALRSSFASQLYEVGVDVDTIAGLLGHSSMNSLRNYIASNKERLLECLIDVPPIDNRVIISRMRDYRHGL